MSEEIIVLLTKEEVGQNTFSTVNESPFLTAVIGKEIGDGGGVMVFVNDELKHKRRTDQEDSPIYRPPS